MLAPEVSDTLLPGKATKLQLLTTVPQTDTGARDEYSKALERTQEDGMISPVLTPASVPTATGTGMHFILIEFFQEVNGSQYMLNNGAFNVLNLLKLS